MEISRVCKQGLLNCINFAHRLNHIRRVPYREMASNNDNDIIEKCKADAARLAVNENISDDCVVGIGSGSTMTYVLDELSDLILKHGHKISCIPTSLQSKQLIYDYDLMITDLDRNPVIDLTIDGADEVDRNLVAIKGGGACLAQEKVIAAAARKFCVVADYRKESQFLGQTWRKGVPIEVLPMAQNLVRHRIAGILKVDAIKDVILRIGKEKAGPVITDNGNLVLDVINHSDFTKDEWLEISNKIRLVPGVVETGIFADMIDVAYFGQRDGSVTKRARS